jgi:hypothetical protein
MKGLVADQNVGYVHGLIVGNSVQVLPDLDSDDYLPWPPGVADHDDDRVVAVGDSRKDLGSSQRRRRDLLLLEPL